MENEKINPKTEETKKLKFKEGRATKIVDGLADGTVAAVKIGREIGLAPLRIAGRVIDGIVQGSKKGVMGAVQGTVNGIVDGLGTTGAKIGEGFKEIGDSYYKISDGVSKKHKITESSSFEGSEVTDIEPVEEKKE